MKNKLKARLPTTPDRDETYGTVRLRLIGSTSTHYWMD